jgi:hypothetical protein
MLFSSRKVKEGFVAKFSFPPFRFGAFFPPGHARREVLVFIIDLYYIPEVIFLRYIGLSVLVLDVN